MTTSRLKNPASMPIESTDQLFSASNKRTRNVNTVWKNPLLSGSSGPGSPTTAIKIKTKNDDGKIIRKKNIRKKAAAGRGGMPPRRNLSSTSSNVTEVTRSSTIISMTKNNNSNNKKKEEDMPITEDSLLETTFTTTNPPPSPMTDWHNSVSGDGDDSYLIDLEGGREKDSPPLKSRLRSMIEDDDDDDDNDDDNDDDDDGDDSEDEKTDNSLSFSLTQMISNSVLFPAMMPETTTKDVKPRSAYDKDAEWYCGSDADMNGSMRSDGSSVLSLFRKPKKKNTNETKTMDMDNESSITNLFSVNNDQDGISEYSMGISTLLGKDEESGSTILQQNNNNDNTNTNTNTNKVIPAMQSEPLQIVSMDELLSEIEDINADDEESLDTTSSSSNSNSTTENEASLLVDGDNNIKNDDIFSFDTFDPEEEEENNNENESPSFLEKITSKNAVRSAFVVLGLTGVLDIVLLGLFLTH
jgi:hypothetical protein